MLQLIILSIILVCSSAQWGNYNEGNGFGSYNKVYDGFNRGGLNSYNSEPHGSYGHGYGYGFEIKHKSNYKPVYHKQYLYVRPAIIKRLPPIYKHVKQPVYIEQPVIIRTIPVFKNTKSVTVKNLPPIINHKETTIEEKDVKYEMNVHEMPKYEMPVMEVPKGPTFGMRIPKKEDNSVDMPGIDMKEQMIPMHGMVPMHGMADAVELDKMPRGMDPIIREQMKPETGGQSNGDFNGNDFDV